MAKINPDEFAGTKSPKVSIKDLQGKPRVLWTIVAVDQIEVDDEGTKTGKRRALTLIFEGLEEKVFWLNETMIGYLIEVFGDETDNWIGQTVPCEPHRSVVRGQAFEKVWISAPASWPKGTDVPPKKNKS